MSTTTPPEARKKAGRPSDIAKRESILVAASEAFFDRGFAATSIEQVAADAGVSKVTIYNHFADKSGLFAAAVERECENMRGLFTIDPGGEGTIADRLTRLGQVMTAFLARPEMVQFDRRIAAETEHDASLGRAFLEAGPWRIKQAFSAWLVRADAAGELRIADPALAAEQFVAMCKGIGDLERRFGVIPTDADNRRRIEGAVKVFLAAYSPDTS